MSSDPSIKAERKDAILLAFAVVIRTLTAASKLRKGEAAEVLLESAEAVGNVGDGVAELLAAQTLASRQ